MLTGDVQQVARDSLRFAEIEKLLELPPGSARRRRLALLRIQKFRVEGTEFRRGDRLVIEPGTHPSGGRMVVCRMSHALVLRVVRLGPRGIPLLASPDPERLALVDVPLHAIVGTVIAALRACADGTHVAIAPHYRFHDSDTWRKDPRLEFELRNQHRLALTNVLRELELHVQRARNATAERQIAAAITRLRSLGSCLEAVEDERLYRALAQEVNRVVMRLRRSVSVHWRWVPLQESPRGVTSDHDSRGASHSFGPVAKAFPHG